MLPHIEKIFSAVLKEAKSRRDNARFSGEHGDRGASNLETQVRFYKYGQQQILPEEWVQFSTQVDKEIDPEYSDFLRLKKKFGE